MNGNPQIPLESNTKLKNILKKFEIYSKDKLCNEISLIKKPFALNLFKISLSDELLDKLIEMNDATVNMNELYIKINDKLSYDKLAKFFRKLYKKKQYIKLGFYLKNVRKDLFDIFLDYLGKLNKNCNHLLIRIKTLDRSFNDFVHTEIFSKLESISNDLYNLTSIDLSYNSFYSHQPIKNLKNFINKSKICDFIANEMIFIDNITKTQFCKILNQRTSILDLHKNNINLSTINEFTKSLLGLGENNLINLNLSVNNIDKRSMKIMSEFLFSSCCKIINLNLSYNYIGDEGCQIISHYLICNKKINSINLTHNFIYDLGLQFLGQGLEINSSLESLNLNDNYISEIGVISLSETLCTNFNYSLKLSKINLTWNKIKPNIGNDLAIALANLYSTYCNNFKSILLGDNKISDISCSKFLFHITKEQSIKNIIKIDFSFNELKSDSMIPLSDFLAINPVEKLYLQHNSLRNEGINFLSNGLSKNKSLRILNLSKTDLRNSEGAISLTESLKSNNVLEELYLNENSISSEGIERIATYILKKRSLVYLNLAHNKICHVGAQYLGDNLTNALGIKKLILNSNKIADIGAKYLAKGVAENYTLDNLNLENNEIGDEGIISLTKAILARSNFSTLNVSCNNFTTEGANHLAKIAGIIDNINFSSNLISYYGLKNIIVSLQDNPRVTTLKLSNGKFGSFDIENSNENDNLALRDIFKLNNTIKKFNFIYNSIDEKSCSIIFNCFLENQVITYLDLRDNKISDKGVQYISDYLSSKNTILKVLYLQTNKITEVGAIYISTALNTNKSLKELNLSDNLLGNRGVNNLAESLLKNSTLLLLSLNYTGIDVYCVDSIEEMLKTNKTLNSLNLYGNNLADNGVYRILNSIIFNKSLRHISLGSNNFTDHALRNIKNVLKFNKSLKIIEFNTGNLTKKSAYWISEGLRYNDTVSIINFINNKIDFEGIYKLILALKKNTQIVELKLLLNSVDADHRKIILNTCEHIIFN